MIFYLSIVIVYNLSDRIEIFIYGIDHIYVEKVNSKKKMIKKYPKIFLR